MAWITVERGERGGERESRSDCASSSPFSPGQEEREHETIDCTVFNVLAPCFRCHRHSGRLFLPLSSSLMSKEVLHMHHEVESNLLRETERERDRSPAKDE